MDSKIVVLGGFLILAALVLPSAIGAVAVNGSELKAQATGEDNDPRVTGIDYMPIYDPVGEHVESLTGVSTGDAGNLIYGGGALQTRTFLYVCYWGWTSDPSGEKAYYEGFMSGVGGSTWMSVDNQYGVNNPTGLLKGTWSDTTSVPNRPSQTDVNNAGIRCQNHFGYNANAQYVVATPTGHSQSGFGTRWCAYHEGLSYGGHNVAVSYLPYITDAGASCGKNFVNSGSAGLLDGVSMVGGHEMMETQTDPKPCSGWCDSGGAENADKCAWSSMSRDISIGGKSYAVQPIWSNKISGCSVTG